MSSICRKFNHPRIQIYRILKKFNVLVPHKKLSFEEIITAYDNGQSVKQIAYDNHCSYKRICSIITKNKGIQVI